MLERKGGEKSLRRPQMFSKCTEDGASKDVKKLYIPHSVNKCRLQVEDFTVNSLSINKLGYHSCLLYC